MSSQQDKSPFQRMLETDGHFFDSYLERWSQSRWQRFEERHILESDFTRLLAAADGDLEVALTADFMDAAGVEPASGRRYRLLEPWNAGLDRRRRANRRTSQEPDLLVASTDEPSGADDVAWSIEVAIEVKFGADVNGGWGYCPSGRHANYSNQIVCYMDDCWLQEDRASAHLWVAGGHADRTFSDVRTMRGRRAANWNLSWFELPQAMSWSRWRQGTLARVVGRNGSFERVGLGGIADYLRSCSPFLATQTS